MAALERHAAAAAAHRAAGDVPCSTQQPHHAGDLVTRADAASHAEASSGADELTQAAGAWEAFHARDNATARFYKERRCGGRWLPGCDAADAWL